MRRGFSARIVFSAAGARLPEFRNALRERRFPCSGQRIAGGRFHAAVRARHWYGIVRLAEEYGITVETEQRRGLRFLVRPYRFRFGLLAGLLLGGYLLYQSNAFVRQIRITGNSRVSESEILHALSSLGVEYGTPFRNMEFTYLEQRMRLAVHDIEWIALRHTGGTLYVDLTEEREKPDLHNTRIPSNYVAAVQAQITEITVLNGRAVRKRGDAVRPGDLLISGVEENRRGITRYAHAEGSVRGIYETEFCQEQAFCAEVTVHGTPQTADYLEFLGWRIPLEFGFSPPEGDCEYTEQHEPIMLLGIQLPVMRLRCIYTPRGTAPAVYTAEEVRAMLTEAAARYVRNFHAADDLLGEDAVFTETENGMVLRVRYTFEGEIGRLREIFID
ncbi:MAG: sporulation protein YqfD [Oscillospiraceae bacterium]|nr:sporulation protein YqfD [Oscillospiraceae bacterium]